MKLVTVRLNLHLVLWIAASVFVSASSSSCPASNESTCTMPPLGGDDTAADDLPRWELNKRFGFLSPFDPALDKYVEETTAQAKAFQEKYEGKLKDVSLRECIAAYERIAVRRGTVGSYLSLQYDTQLENDELKKRKGNLGQLQSQAYGDHLEWFSLDLAAMAEADLEAQYEKDPSLKEAYSPFIEETRRFKPHNLAKDVERALTVRSPWTGTRQTVSFFDKETSLMRFVIKEGDEPVDMKVLLSHLGSSKDATVRANCLKALNDGLGGAMGRVAALSLSTVAGSWHIENIERQFKNLRTQRNLGNNVPDEVVDSLLLGVRTAGVPLCKRYYALKKKILFQTQGLKEFRWSDRNAPIDIEGGSKEDEKIPWTECVKIVEKGYRSFSPRMADMFMGFVEEKRIDVPPDSGKMGGAYCSSAVPEIGPFQLLNYDGSKDGIATVAHESGHAVHNVMAYPKGYLQFHPPLTLAETASIFGEMILFRDLLQMAKSPAERLALLMSKVDDILNSVVRQCSFDRFEELAHTARKDGELSAEELDKFWMQTVEEYYGKLDDEDTPWDSYDNIDHLWAYVPHFHHVPFYVYSYAFADLVVGTLYHSFQTTPEGFEDRLLELLAAGGTKDFAEALKPFGLDPKSPSFWEDAIKAHLGGLMAEAEALAAELGFGA